MIYCLYNFIKWYIPQLKEKQEMDNWKNVKWILKRFYWQKPVCEKVLTLQKPVWILKKILKINLR